VLVRTISGAEGYVQVKYVVRAPSAEDREQAVHVSHVPADGRKQPSSTPLEEASRPSLTSGAGHSGEWRAVDERPEPGRYSTSGERLGDISKCVTFSICIFTHHL
jgi:hypothetical protein